MSDELQTGDHVGSYLLGERLGGGGFGAVWKATDRETGRVVALKVLRTDLYSSDTTKLRGEVELLAGSASSSSRHVVKVLGGGVEPRPYVVMEYVEGIDLGREIERRRRIPQMETIRIGLAVAEALGALQAVGIIHRDVKPSNIMIDSDGDTKLTDFGIAKIVGFDTITATSQMPMTQAYAAPEVWEGKASHQSDLYALGCVLFQCLTGRPPFTGSIAELFRSHTLKDPDWTMLPEGTVPALRDLLRTCLAKAEDDRPASAAEVVHALDAAERELQARLAGSTATDLPVHEPQAFGPWLRREPHLTQPWAFLCINETTGEKATVEIHFADDIEYGSRLRKAVEVNPKLVPLGAERLLGTNRLVLRPGEAWNEAPVGQFAFWVAREELPVRPGPEVVDEAMLVGTAGRLVALSDAAASSGLDLRFPASSLALFADGTVVLRRPGLWDAGDDGMEWLRSLPLEESASGIVQRGKRVTDLRVVGDAAGFAQLAQISTYAASLDESAMVGISVGRTTNRRIPEPPVAVPIPSPEPERPWTLLGADVPRELELEGQEPKRRYWWYVAGTAAFFVGVPAVLGLVIWAWPDNSRGKSAATAQTATTAPTSTPEPTRSPTAGATPSATSALSSPSAGATLSATSALSSPTAGATPSVTHSPTSTQTPVATPTYVPTVPIPSSLEILGWSAILDSTVIVKVTFRYDGPMYDRYGVFVQLRTDQVDSEYYRIINGVNTVVFDFSNRTWMYCNNPVGPKFYRLEIFWGNGITGDQQIARQYITIPWSCGQFSG